MIDDKPLRFRGELYHPYHFNCTTCGIELNSEAREVRSRPGYAANEMVRLCGLNRNHSSKKIFIKNIYLNLYVQEYEWKIILIIIMPKSLTINFKQSIITCTKTSSINKHFHSLIY